MKDHYKILGVSPAATTPEIKKAYRTLAFRYHPDKNPGDPLSEATFRNIQEAYTILSSPQRRAAYDDERWLAGISSRRNFTEAITPAWLAKVATQLNADLAHMDTHRMSQRALQQYILLILDDAHLGILRQHNDTETNHTIIRELLKATAGLHARHLEPVRDRLLLLADGDSPMCTLINDTMEERDRRARWERSLPYFVITVTLLLCLLMYWFGR